MMNEKLLTLLILLFMIIGGWLIINNLGLIMTILFPILIIGYLIL